MTDKTSHQGEGAKRRVLLGHIIGAHGIRGAVLVRSYTADPDGIASYGPLQSEDGRGAFVLSVEGETAKGLICRVEGVSDRTRAETLKGTALYVSRDRLPPPEDGEYYHADLIGLAAQTEDGAPLGTVVAVANYGAGDILDVRPEGASRTVLYPMTDDVVRRVDIAGGVIVLAPPDEVDAGDEGVDEPDDA
ncbi:MAG: ribosome maturation factor RimM [Hyphomicrobium sp.]|jgi:16S rRNA processing protein RimM|uniref:ribosome maturation factor RimM n=1 Tax=Hyphomicrobium sp. TaxID=82 RepID=UPI0025BA074F|nr:ribosome maturation factor RimM [Hyphomicrobium sp.]MBX9863739.1 ribosome maturation factor RimM [Hyphomicrobium sp.]